MLCVQIKNWKRRWFELHGFQLAYYKSERKPGAAGKPQGACCLCGCCVSAPRVPTARRRAGTIDVREFTVERTTCSKSKLALRLVSRRNADQVRAVVVAPGWAVECGNGRRRA